MCSNKEVAVSFTRNMLVTLKRLDEERCDNEDCVPCFAVGELLYHVEEAAIFLGMAAPFKKLEG